jgi:carbonic anhydrase/acetyltransferase-like protein (isoleucine patch superfamily)
MAIHRLDGVGPELPSAGDFWVAPSATIIGKVTLGQGVGVWFGTVMRGDNERITVGDDSNVQELCMFHTDMGFPLTIGMGCTIGHRAIIHGCIIGDNTLVGMGATVMNGVRIGDNCLIAAGALIPEGRTIPSGSLVMGVPGKPVRQLSAEEIEANRNSAIHYVANWKRYARGLGPPL